MSRTLMILFPEKEPDTKHICYRNGCPLFTGEIQDGLCKVLWETPPEFMKGKLACMCNFYDTMKPVIVEADGVNCGEVIKRVESGKDYPYTFGWRKNSKDNKPQIKHSIIMFTTHGVAEGEWLGNEWYQYRWSCKVKDSEVLYWAHLSDLERLEKEQ